MAYNFVIIPGKLSTEDFSLFLVLKQNLRCHRFKDKLEVAIAATRWLVIQDTE
jgi:hypothetical protein